MCISLVMLMLAYNGSSASAVTKTARRLRYYTIRKQMLRGARVVSLTLRVSMSVLTFVLQREAPLADVISSTLVQRRSHGIAQPCNTKRVVSSNSRCVQAMGLFWISGQTSQESNRRHSARVIGFRRCFSGLPGLGTSFRSPLSG